MLNTCDIDVDDLEHQLRAVVDAMTPRESAVTYEQWIGPGDKPRSSVLRVTAAAAAVALLAVGGWLVLRPRDDGDGHVVASEEERPIQDVELSDRIAALDSTATETAPRRVLGSRLGMPWVGDADDGDRAVFISVVDPTAADLDALRRLPELAGVARAIELVPTQYSLDQLLAYRDVAMQIGSDGRSFGAGLGVSSLDAAGQPRINVSVDPGDDRLAELERVIPAELLVPVGEAHRGTG